MRALIKNEWCYLEPSDVKLIDGWRIRMNKNGLNYTKYFKTYDTALEFFKELLFGQKIKTETTKSRVQIRSNKTLRERKSRTSRRR